MPTQELPAGAENAAPAPHAPESDSVPDTSVSEDTTSFPIVGIGASAGGLAAFEAFFSGMPAEGETGMAYVLVQHLAPDHESMLSELVRRYTRMQVFDVEDGMVVRPNCAYIIPPNRDMAFLHGSLHLLEPAARRGIRLSIDFFFSSLAQDQRERAIGIVLSGTGSDGTAGVRAIKAEGGMVMAQRPESTDQDGMPRSAIATGLVDYVLMPAEMPSRLTAYVAHAFGQGLRAPRTQQPVSEDTLNKILVLLRAKTGHDFTQYKRNTVTRRIGRRMALHQIENIDEYLRFVQQTPDELLSLFRDLLIGVTNFFRDPEAFRALEAEAIPRLFEGKPAGATIRVWVPACSTGEEAYSIAILLQERMTALGQAHKVQLFATDIDSVAIAKARGGVYSNAIAADVSAERLARHFLVEPDDGGYRIHKGIRDLLVFSEQDVTRDPPFSKLDLISCRNLLIYLGAALQKKVIGAFHFALKPGGTLFLGTSESVAEADDLFATSNRKWRLFQSKDGTLATQRAALQRFSRLPPRSSSATSRARRPPEETGTQMRDLAEQALREHYGAVAALVDATGDILYLDGRTGRYLEPAPGEPCLNIVKMAREGLRRDLQTALQLASTSGQPAHHPSLRVDGVGDRATVNLTVRPVAPGAPVGARPRLFLVVLEEATASADHPDAPLSDAPDGDAAARSDQRVEALRRELRAKEEYLQTTNEELETSNEELKSANEEMQSVNEEMQSTNEELETSREELQSLNEELATVNAELQNRVSDLSRANNDMNNLLAGMGVGTVFVDHQLRVQRFTPAATNVINLIPSDVGRAVGHIASNLLGYDRLVEDLQAVLATLVPKEVEVKSRAGAWYLLRIRPYRTLENSIEGAVITFFDITEMKQAQEAVKETTAIRGLTAAVRDSRDAITVTDLSGRVLAWNAGAQRIYGWTETDAMGMNLLDRVPESRRAHELQALQTLTSTDDFKPHRTERISKDGRVVRVWLTASALLDAEGRVYAIGTTEREHGRAPSAPAEGTGHE